MESAVARRGNRSSAISHFLSFVRTLSFIVGITLGFGAIFAGVWSKFLLPLLYSSFSARKAVTEQQLHAFRTIVTKLRRIRSNERIYGPIALIANQSDIGAEIHVRSDVDRSDTASQSSLPVAKLSDSLLIEEVPEDSSHQLARSGTSPTTDSNLSFLVTPTDDSPSPFTHLSESLTTLTLCMDATSTTRTSLLSTASSFTAQLNTQAFQFATRRPGAGGRMSGLDAGLVKAGADPNAVNPEKQGEEGGTVTVEDVKREIRGLKGLLLSRREFPHMKR
ncbi:hypothetical protein NliqN6_4957 [Naganishia liquefaciens]|uniref:Uncharacterized protein n=1 Tax=Naganishia liquefaciens TaxID=104408 RepID=A0A8H3YG85_9TREE|nr:hypothetical protein NliqN6_4957 [Naganishia liquefaciens]